MVVFHSSWLPPPLSGDIAVTPLGKKPVQVSKPLIFDGDKSVGSIWVTNERKHSKEQARKQIELVSNSVLDFSCFNMSPFVSFEESNVNGDPLLYGEQVSSASGSKACNPPG